MKSDVQMKVSQFTPDLSICCETLSVFRIVIFISIPPRLSCRYLYGSCRKDSRIACLQTVQDK